MKFLLNVLSGIFLMLITVATLSAGEVVLHGGAQKPGDISRKDAYPLAIANALSGDFGSTFGARFSKGRVVGFEQSIGFSPQFAKSGVKAFQTDSNLLVQFPGKIVPYGTVGIGYARTWGGDLPKSFDPEEIAAFAFSMGNSFTINYGGGLKLRRLWGPLGINIDVRGYTLPGVETVVVTNEDNNRRTENRCTENRCTEKGLNFVQTTAGLTLTW